MIDSGKVKKYILSNYNKYGILNEYGKPITKAEMLALLNILESNDECLDSFHDVAFNGYNEFCGIYSDYENDNDTYSALMAHHRFMTDSDLFQFVQDKWDEYVDNEEEESLYFGSFANYFLELYDNDITRTSDGYVIRYEYWFF